MTTDPLLGVFLHAVGGLAAASFYLPLRGIRNWSWESYWLVGGIFSWLIAPLVGAGLICPDLLHTLTSAPRESVIYTYGFGVLWGVGGLTFGLAMRFLGLSLGYALALGFCAAFGTVLPPVFRGESAELIGTLSGLVTLAGVAVCLLGIAVCGVAGVQKERDVPDAEKQKTVVEFNFVKGLWVAVFAGVMSACMAFAIAAGAPIQATAIRLGTPDLFSNLPVLVVALLGGLTTNLVWCLYLNWARGSAGDYLAHGSSPLVRNYLLCALAGVTWYLQFFFYSMGTTRMGAYDFSSWTIHMAFIIAFSNLWGLLLKEWQGTRLVTRNTVLAGILVLISSTIIVGVGNYLAGT